MRSSVEDEDSSYLLIDNRKAARYDCRPRKAFTFKCRSTKSPIPFSPRRSPIKAPPNRSYLMKPEKPVHRDAGYTKLRKGLEQVRPSPSRTQSRQSFQESPRSRSMGVLSEDMPVSGMRQAVRLVDKPLKHIFGSIHQELKHLDSFSCHDSLCEDRPHRKWFPDFENTPREDYSNPLSESPRSPSCRVLKRDKPDRRWGKGTPCCRK